jgi:propanediol dehydratase small subunit
MKSAKILTALTAVLLVTTTAAAAAEMFNRIASFPVALNNPEAEASSARSSLPAMTE